MIERDAAAELRDGKSFKVEPSADLRAVAKTLYGTYTALIDEGFSEDQALTLVANLLTAAVGADDE